MKLQFPFSQETRQLFFDVRYLCFFCGRNDTELHHIAGRISNSPLNGAVLCKECHSHVIHSELEEKMLFEKTLRYLVKIHYTFTENDVAFIDSYKRLFDVVFHSLDNLTVSTVI